MTTLTPINCIVLWIYWGAFPSFSLPLYMEGYTDHKLLPLYCLTLALFMHSTSILNDNPKGIHNLYKMANKRGRNYQSSKLVFNERRRIKQRSIERVWGGGEGDARRFDVNWSTVICKHICIHIFLSSNSSSSARVQTHFSRPNHIFWNRFHIFGSVFPEWRRRQRRRWELHSWTHHWHFINLFIYILDTHPPTPLTLVISSDPTAMLLLRFPVKGTTNFLHNHSHLSHTQILTCKQASMQAWCEHQRQIESQFH